MAVVQHIRFGHDGDSEAAGHQRGDAGLSGGIAEYLRRPAALGDVRHDIPVDLDMGHIGDKGVGGELTEQDLVLRSQRMVRRHDGHQLLVQQGDELHLRLALLVDTEDHVIEEGLQPVQQLPGGQLPKAEGDLLIAWLLEKGPHRLGHEFGGEGGDVAHVDVALPRAGGPLQGGVHRVQAAQEGVHLLKIEQAVFAQFQVASLSEKEGDSQLPFQAGDGGAEGGLGDHQLFRGPVEVQLSGCCPKIIELIQCQIAAPPQKCGKISYIFPYILLKIEKFVKK